MPGISKTLSLEPMHGFGIARSVERIWRGVFKVNPGSLFTALQWLERAAHEGQLRTVGHSGSSSNSPREMEAMGAWIEQCLRDANRLDDADGSRACMASRALPRLTGLDERGW